ncbi:Hydroperoxy fatty acid reductase gpx1 [Austwickia sp. TVS 96-490-7B]|uniref:glutathione peroxidase n=1 Tax=Austwickia sp. TVS 96-490-7B TaxID=2830843 RepID=UPI001C56D9DD|nr:glutathione peroxidase [Austwickia sp. TVS 96-490-7B]MBW3085363.1 Hydroperoxy fatty acid reductase gpx1 [Austwickia sp. TVS 96-490-7B]
MSTLHDFTATALDGTEKSLADYAGKVVLVVNTASKCGLTPQLEGLQQLHEEYAEQGLAILGFPCNQFAGQEPGDADEIGEFCTKNYGVSFQMFDKVKVNGPDTHPVYAWLKSQKRGTITGGIKWNFAKFLVGRDGKVIDRYAPITKPEALRADIEAALAQA